jgi:2-polyprenyl-3-methyl-5-hydroxy-6-metoxy-1,4-benzoquinol methylase
VIDRPVLSVGRRVRLHHVIHAVEPLLTSDARVLDAGSFDGRLAADVAAAHRDCHVVAADEDEAAVAAARARAKRLPNLRVERAVIGEETTLADFDVVVCSDVLEHIADEEAAFEWLALRLRPEGHLLVHVPAEPQEHAIREVGEAMAAEVASGNGPHLRLGYSLERLCDLTAASGLIVIDHAWTFYRPLTRLAVDVDTWTYLRNARAIKLALLPFLISASALERAPSRVHRGNGVLLHAQAPG